MRELWQFQAGEQVFQAAVYYDDGDNPIAEEGPSTYERSEQAAKAFAVQSLCDRTSGPGGFWYATLARGRVVDPIDDGRPYDHAFEPEPDWSHTILAEEAGR